MALLSSHQRILADHLVYVEAVFDVSAGGSAVTENFFTIPVDAILFNFGIIVTQTFNGNATTEATVDSFVSPSGDSTDSVAAPDETAGSGVSYLASSSSPKGLDFYAAATPITVTWTNTAAATEGKFRVWLIYYRLPH